MQALPVIYNRGQNSCICRSCQQQFWGLTASSLNAAEHCAVAKAFETLMPSKLFPHMLHEEPLGITSELRSAGWMEEQLKDCLLDE